MEYLGKIVDGRFITRGVTWGYGGVYPEIKHRNGRWAVMKRPGVTEWVCLGSTGYYPSKYWLATLDTVPDRRLGASRGDMVTVMKQEGQEVEPGRRWKRALEELKAECDRRAELDG